ncbi:uncharacterized protein LOC143533543 [Bidens hawaiensis]|uniref:uncharacterized protein LOC143533543 n=1 Tax=Bidens hawaiensis TaxID=980011 RepID=UPI00404B715F
MNMSSLVSLFLGNNSLSGSLLPDISTNLLNIDFSYNQLSGSLPQWVTPMWSRANLQLNLVANNFIFDSTNISIFPGLNCLQRGFPCNRNTTPYSSFAIKCGGPATRSLNNILFETENDTTLGPASYDLYQEKWAVSNGGIVIDRPDPTFIVSTSMRVDGTRYPELFRTSRKSPGSLRYYGLGLVNGPYTVRLFFAETVFNRTPNTWTGHGRRMFDIYIQGNRRQKDFDISKEAGGIGRALEKEFDVTVTQNFLEIHLFWAGKGTCCIPEQGDYGPLISAIQVSPGFKVKSNSNKTGMIVGIVASVASVSLLLLVFGFYMKRKRSKHGEEVVLTDIPGIGPKVQTYTFTELKAATADFSSANLLGEGGFGSVYKGILNDGSVVAVKQLSVASPHGRSQFIAEISTISTVQHWNLVKLHGFCVEGSRRLLIYEYLENKSLDQALFGKTNVHLDWSTRFNICLGTARGLAYLHEESRPKIVHRDVKASNILLDGELCPKISDFGLAKLYDDKRTHMSTRVAGTIGYLAPEYAMRGHLTSKADVFGFGVVCLEIVSGRPNHDEKLNPEQKYLLQWAWSLYENNRQVELIDPSLSSFNEQEATRMVGVALLCVQASPSLRPAMSRVITMLSGDVEILAVTTDWDFNDTTNTFDDEEPMSCESTTMMTATTNTTSTGIIPVPTLDTIKSSVLTFAQFNCNSTLSCHRLNYRKPTDAMVFRFKFQPSIPQNFIIFILCIIQISNAKTTDPSEVTALRTIFQKWDVPNPRNMYNISGEPCSGPALSGYFDLDYNDTAIECNCSFDSNSTCHITKLKINKLISPGVILEEFAALTYLTTLKIDKNALTGTMPRWFGNFSSMLFLSVDHNQLTGTLPRELANLKNLIMLAIGSNKFSGTLPPELGNVVTLELLYLDSCGLGGEIPSTFANLTKMREMWASDGPFSGKIPSFIGGWTKLQRLRLQGNNFEGPIPASFSNLTSLISLRISDLQNASSSLDFVTTLRNLTDLVIRNALVSGPIPSNINQLQKLETLDLSFNNLNGSLPQTLMNMSSLVSLFLGNNSLSGSLLPEKGTNLQNIDLSYNQLSGSFPQWVRPTWSIANLQLNLVANNFIFDNTNISTFPGLNCLQRGFPCNKNTTPTYSSLAIKCGGPAMSVDNILFDPENDTTLGPAAFKLYQDKWAVSNGGIAIDRRDPTFIISTSMLVNNTRYPELFRTSRMSPNSLRYYGLGLVNGPYTVKLFFAETVFDLNNNSWTGHGRRVFDIYIQGNRKQKDFDISKEAGGIGRALEKEFDIIVTQNYLEIHLFWAGKGTCCIPEQGDYGPLISAIRVSPGFKVKSDNSNKTGMIIGIVASVASVSVLLLIFGLYMKRKRSKNREEDEILGMGPKVKTYTYAELKTATADFSSANLLGEGGFGPVYKGMLNDGSVVAVKQLSVASHHGRSQFIAEISTISAVQHWNLVKLHGSCLEGSRRLLVYEYLENKSLDQALFGKTNVHLDWSTRFNICMGTAKGLAYLHEESRPRIVHRDVKASNILLDGELCPKISDFGLAKLYDDKKTHMSTRVAGTIGYLAPEYAMRGHLTSKADVFGFGVVCLEIVSGRPNYDEKVDPEQKYLLQWAWSLYENNRQAELIDPSLSSVNEQETTRMIGVALLCVQGSPAARPAMSRVIAMLSGDVEIPHVTTKPSYLTDWDFNDITNDYDDGDLNSFESTSMMTATSTANTTTSTGVNSMSSPVISSEVISKGSLRAGR